MSRRQAPLDLRDLRATTDSRETPDPQVGMESRATRDRRDQPEVRAIREVQAARDRQDQPELCRQAAQLQPADQDSQADQELQDRQETQGDQDRTAALEPQETRDLRDSVATLDEQEIWDLLVPPDSRATLEAATTARRPVWPLAIRQWHERPHGPQPSHLLNDSENHLPAGLEKAPVFSWNLTSCSHSFFL